MKVWPTVATILSWGHNDRLRSDFVCSLVLSGSFTFLLDSKCESGIICVYKKNLSLVKPTLQVTSKIPHGNWGCLFSRVKLFVGNPDDGEAPAPHIASGDVQNAFHHMGIPEWLRPYFCWRLVSARAFGMTGKIAQGVRVSGEQKLFPAALTLPMEFFPGACSFASMSASSRRTVRI